MAQRQQDHLIDTLIEHYLIEDHRVEDGETITTTLRKPTREEADDILSNHPAIQGIMKRIAFAKMYGVPNLRLIQGGKSGKNVPR